MMERKKIIWLIFFILLLSSLVFHTLERRVGLGGEDHRWEVEWITTPGVYGPGDYGREIEVGGRERFYKFHVPLTYEGAPTPVVLAFHGGGGYPGIMRYRTGFDEIADREKFIVVYPAGTSKHGFSDRLLSWNDGRPFADGTLSQVDDVAYVNALLDDLPTLFRVDESRVYATGFSNGAQFTNRLAQQLSHRIAAIATVAGHRGPDSFFPAPNKPISKIQFSGKKDLLAPYQGGQLPDKIGPMKIDLISIMDPVEETMQAWAKHNGCPPNPVRIERIGNAEKKVWAWCENQTRVELWTLEDGGHTWPGGKMSLTEEKMGLGTINRNIMASEKIWEFFEKLALN